MKNPKRISKLMSLVLRHQPEAIGLELDSSGWVTVKHLIEGIRKKGFQLTVEELHQLVAENDKQRFVISADGLKIRANQGHSVNIDLELEVKEPPTVLYHGTVAKFMDSIREKGLLKMSRQHVHLSADKTTAIKVGSRRGAPIILVINALEMHKKGFTFYQSENGVWLTDEVGPEYIKM